MIFVLLHPKFEFIHKQQLNRSMITFFTDGRVVSGIWSAGRQKTGAADFRSCCSLRLYKVLKQYKRSLLIKLCNNNNESELRTLFIPLCLIACQAVDQSTPVHLACTSGWLEILQLLLRWVGHVFAYTESRDDQGRTCLHR